MKKYETVALVIDMQPRYLARYLKDPNEKRNFEEQGKKGNHQLHLLPSKAKDLIRNQKSMLQECLRSDIPIGILEYSNGGPTIPQLKKMGENSCWPIYVNKSHDDGFSKTNLEEQLKEIEAQKLLLMGINASYCVLSTASGAVYRGFKVFTSPSLIDDAGKETKKSSDWYEQNGVWVKKPKDLLSKIAA